MPGVPLSAAGRDQAAALAQRLAGTRIDWIDASPLERTRDTAAAVAGPHGLVPAEAPDLIEIDMGDWTGRAFDTLTDDPDWARWNQERGAARIPGGETMAEAQARILAHLRRVAAERPGTTGALVTHSDMIRGAVAGVLGLSLDHVLRFDIDPASVTRVVMGDWGARLLALNETAG